jgi:hypothetical protein
LISYQNSISPIKTVISQNQKPFVLKTFQFIFFPYPPSTQLISYLSSFSP